MPAFTWPTDQRAVSSGFTDRRSYGQHNGIDIPAPMGDPIRALADGTVIFAGAAGSAGLAVFLEHPDGWRSHYCHLSMLHVAREDPVGQGEWIGDIGSTGVSTGPHLHLNLFAPSKPPTGLSQYVAWVGLWAVDPLDYLTEEDDTMTPEQLLALADKAMMTLPAYRWEDPTTGVVNLRPVETHSMRDWIAINRQRVLASYFRQDVHRRQLRLAIKALAGKVANLDVTRLEADLDALERQVDELDEVIVKPSERQA